MQAFLTNGGAGNGVGQTEVSIVLTFNAGGGLTPEGPSPIAMPPIYSMAPAPSSTQTQAPATSP